jgi:uncharacterized membrane protein SpoIIM required for sporulation
MDALQLKSFEFRRQRERTWRELERLILRVEKSGLHGLQAPELSRLPILYRATLSSLSVARAISLDRNLLEYLESLAARAFFCVYGSKSTIRHTFGRFFTHRFPDTVRRFRWYIAMAALFMLLGAVTSYVLVARSPEWYYSFVDPNLAGGRDPAATTEFLRDGLYERRGGAAELSNFASFLFTHNARVGILAFALGFLAGLPVYILIFLNGLMLGAFAALYHSRGLGPDLWGWLLPHGVTELGAIILCGGAGLALAHSLVFPGRYKRLQNLARRGREAGIVVMGAVCMLLAAGLIEGIFRQRVTDIYLRYIVIGATTLFWAWYFLRVGREPEGET